MKWNEIKFMVNFVTRGRVTLYLSRQISLTVTALASRSSAQASGLSDKVFSWISLFSCEKTRGCDIQSLNINLNVIALSSELLLRTSSIPNTCFTQTYSSTSIKEWGKKYLIVVRPDKVCSFCILLWTQGSLSTALLL